MSLKLTPVTGKSEKKDLKGAEADTFHARWVCPVTILEMNGKNRFYALRPCGCVLSERALKEVPSSTCLKCSKPYKMEDAILLAPSKEEAEEMKAKLEAKHAKKEHKKEAKEHKKDEAEHKKEEEKKKEEEERPAAKKDERTEAGKRKPEAAPEAADASAKRRLVTPPAPAPVSALATAQKK